MLDKVVLNGVESLQIIELLLQIVLDGPHPLLRFFLILRYFKLEELINEAVPQFKFLIEILKCSRGAKFFTQLYLLDLEVIQQRRLLLLLVGVLAVENHLRFQVDGLKCLKLLNYISETLLK